MYRDLQVCGRGDGLRAACDLPSRSQRCADRLSRPRSNPLLADGRHALRQQGHRSSLDLDCASLTAMSAAWFGLLGVVVGGLITTLWSWLATVRHELSDGLVGARLVDEELRSVEAQAQQMPEMLPQFSPNLWGQHRAALARVLGGEQWEAVAAAYRIVDQWSVSGDGNRVSLAVLQEAVQQARVELRPLVAGKRHILPQRWRNALASWRP